MASPEPDALAAAARTFAATWQRVLTDPRGFFAEMPETGGLRDPLVFLALCAALDGVGHGLVRLSVAAGVCMALERFAAGVALAALLVLVAQHLLDGHAGFEPTFRAVAYGAAPVVLAWVPRLGVLALVWAAYLTVCGVERVQQLDRPRAALAVLIAVAVLGGIAVALAGGPMPPGLR
jgi:hypothetical protein